ncbi:NADP-dependent alcohol dehydrogenase [Grosmannia clavigera kw1407]|uniref:NADP-dependent alcohol dehydrogenase n=1 Tax=Grosmannia clavigera (strain kw1407 / UAMH 11150) TaxID=655863 RepID=F0XQU3_GROCL|nr:NADP-dependent alcohol dehydrogenase [Grosmannia clavigera kw1407]EFW99811.1 NADP-dependent alcohol dehydrogenase [Grosmannia clavigera kw1407]
MSTHSLKYLAGGEDGKIRLKTAVRSVSGVEVLVRITHSGVCGTDVHDRGHGCGLGHEGIGFVQEVGRDVTAVQVGDRSCGHCRECVSGFRQCCPKAVGQAHGDHEGSFSNFVVRHQDFVYPIPAEIESRHAGPLICAGITVFEGLQIAETKAVDRVGIIGLGGLGHLAVLYARAMGCHVTVFSGRESKKADALKLGATDFRIWRPDSAVEQYSDAKIDVMLLCGSGMPDLECIMPLLGRRARIVPLVIQDEPMVIPYMPFIVAGHRIIGSTTSQTENYAAALNLAARHRIQPWVEEFPMTVEGLTTAMDKLQEGVVLYRAVLSKELGNELV